MRKVTIRLCMCERKKDTVVRLFFPPKNKGSSRTQKATMAKKKKKRAVQNEAKFCFLSRVGKGFCLADEDTLFGEKSIYWCN